VLVLLKLAVPGNRSDDVAGHRLTEDGTAQENHRAQQQQYFLDGHDLTSVTCRGNRDVTPLADRERGNSPWISGIPEIQTRG
jgi:hypothetical protein